MRTYQICSPSVTASGNAFITIPQDGTLVGCDWLIQSTTAAASGDGLAASLTHNQATDTINTNDALGVVAVCAVFISLLTSGQVNTAGTKWCGPMSLPVASGDRFYVHYNETGVGTWRVVCVLHIK